MAVTPTTQSSFKSTPTTPALTPSHSMHHKKACCTCTLCCGVRSSWRDPLIGVQIGGKAALTIAAAFFNPYLAIGNGVDAVWTIITSGLWRRDGNTADLHEVVVMSEQAASDLKETSKDTNALAQQLLIETDNINKDSQQIERFVQQTSSITSKQKEEISELQNTENKLAGEEQKLSKENTALKEQTDVLKRVLSAIKDDLAGFTKEITTFETDIDKFSKEDTKFGKNIELSEKAINKLGTVLAKEVSELSLEIAKAQLASQRTLESFVEQNRALQNEIAELKGTVNQFNVTEQELAHALKTEETLNSTEKNSDQAVKELKDAVLQLDKKIETAEGKLEKDKDTTSPTSPAKSPTRDPKDLMGSVSKRNSILIEQSQAIGQSRTKLQTVLSQFAIDEEKKNNKANQ